MTRLHIIAANCADSVCSNERVYQCDSIEQFENLHSISQIVNQSSAEWFLLTQVITETNQIPTGQSLKVIQENGSTAWLPKVSDSFADFMVLALGGKMASLWTELWKAGAVLAPAQVLRTALMESNSLHEVMAKLNWGESTKERFLEIDWSDCSVDLPELAPTRQHPRLKQIDPLIQNLEQLLPASLDRSSPDFTALRAGLYQWYDALEVSHGYSQDAQHQGRNQAADYWHAIMHRREPDDSNSKYWFRHVGHSPVYAKLLRYAQSSSDDFASRESWDPFAFVDYCSRCRRDSEEEQVAQKIQAVEMVLLMQQTMRDAQK